MEAKEQIEKLERDTNRLKTNQVKFSLQLFYIKVIRCHSKDASIKLEKRHSWKFGELEALMGSDSPVARVSYFPKYSMETRKMLLIFVVGSPQEKDKERLEREKTEAVNILTRQLEAKVWHRNVLEVLSATFASNIVIYFFLPDKMDISSLCVIFHP